MRFLILAFLLAGCVTAVYDEALNARLRARPLSPAPPAPEMRLDRACAVPLEEPFGLPAVRARVGEQNLCLFIDTGAQFCLLRPGLVEALALPASQRVKLALLGMTSQTVLTHVPELSLGPLVCRRLPFAVSPGHLERRFLGISLLRVDGVLGMSFLEHFTVTLDFSRERVTFAPPGTDSGAQEEGASVLPLRFLADGRPCVTVGLGTGEEIDFLLDTGAYLCVVRPELVRRSGLPDMGKTRLLSLGVGIEASLTELPVVSLGTVTAEKVPAYVVPDTHRHLFKHVDGLLGIEVLKRFVMTLDPVRKHLVLRRAG